MKKIGLLPRLIIGLTLGIIVGYISNVTNFEPAVRLLATFNGIFGNFLSYVVPLIIIGFVAPGIAELGKGAGRLLGITTLIAYISTIIAGLFAFAVAAGLLPKIINAASGGGASNPEEALLKGFFTIEIDPIMGVMTALVTAFVLGLGMAALDNKSLYKVTKDFQGIVEKVISSVIIPLLPIHIAGIFANMTYAGEVARVMKVFGTVFAIIIVCHITMLLFQYTVAGTVSGKNPLKALRNMVPAYLTAIGTQSSAATIPVTLRSTKKNDVSNGVADFVVPLCATIHLSGSTITLTMCSMAVLMMAGVIPGLSGMFPFILMLGVTMVAAPGVPGGAVMAALGLLQSMLGFTEAQLGLMIALYIAQDSFGTACNVTGDGAIAMLIDKLAKGTKEVAA